jgi:hypothetical protein
MTTRLKAEWVDIKPDGGHSHEMAQWWINFLFDEENDGNIYQHLEQWGGRSEYDEVDFDTEYLVFDDDLKATAFLLRWA